jgi:hypothetical protein
MATNLSPELLKLLQQQDAATYNKNNLAPLLQGGRYYQPQYAGGGGGGEGGDGNPGTLTGYLGYDQSWADGGKHQGEKGQFYKADGSFSNDYDWSEDGYKNLLLFAAAAGGLAFLPGGMVSTLSGAPAAGTVAGDAFMPSALGAGGSEVAYGSLIPGLESYALPAAAAGGAGGAVAGDAFMPGAMGAGGAPVAQGGLLPGLESYAIPAGAAGSAGAAGGAAPKGGGFWDAVSGKSLGQWAGPAASLIGGALTNKAAGDASDAQIAAAERASALQEPFRQNGLAASNEMTRRLGLRGDPNSAGYGDFTRKFTMADRDADPVYQSGLQFGLGEGTKAINNRAAAGGSFLSGATLKALTRFGNDYGTTKANDSYNRFTNDQTTQYNRLAGVAGSGQTAATQVGNNTMGAGNAQAAGIVGGANAINGALGGAYNTWQNNQIANRYFDNQAQQNQLMSMIRDPRQPGVNYV